MCKGSEGKPWGPPEWSEKASVGTRFAMGLEGEGRRNILERFPNVSSKVVMTLYHST